MDKDWSLSVDLFSVFASRVDGWHVSILNIGLDNYGGSLLHVGRYGSMEFDVLFLRQAVYSILGR